MPPPSKKKKKKEEEEEEKRNTVIDLENVNDSERKKHEIENSDFICK